MPFFIIFIIIPLAELFVFGMVGDEIGLINALFLALITAVIGGAVVRHQGLQTLGAVQNAMQAGKIPAGELFDGICLIISGATLITPGFITDTVGFLLLIPAVRDALKHTIKTHTSWTMDARMGGQHSTHQNHQSHDPHVIDVEFEDINKKP